MSGSHLHNILRPRQSPAVGINLDRRFDTASESLGCLAHVNQGHTSGDGSAALEHLQRNVLIGGHASSRQRSTIVYMKGCMRYRGFLYILNPTVIIDPVLQ